MSGAIGVSATILCRRLGGVTLHARNLCYLITSPALAAHPVAVRLRAKCPQFTVETSALAPKPPACWAEHGDRIP